MIIGIPTEIWRDEKRVALTPAGVFALTQAGHQVLVQSDAGDRCGFSAESYRKARADVAFSAQEVFGRSDLVVKVMPTSVQEAGWLSEDSLLLSWAQLGAATGAVLKVLVERRVTALAYELIEDGEGHLTILTAMSEIAGMLLPQVAGRYLETTHGGRGISLGGVAGIPPCNVVIIGAGIVGSTAARFFYGAGANVTVLDADLTRLRRLANTPFPRVNTALATAYNIAKYVAFSDVLIGAVLIRGRKAPHVVTEEMVQHMKPGSVIIDVSIDQGGCVQTSHPTTLSDPVFHKHGITHYCVPNFPSAVARTASHALNNVVLSYVEELAESGVSAVRPDTALGRGVYLFRGECADPEIAALLERPHRPLETLISEL